MAKKSKMHSDLINATDNIIKISRKAATKKLKTNKDEYVEEFKKFVSVLNQALKKYDVDKLRFTYYNHKGKLVYAPMKTKR